MMEELAELLDALSDEDAARRAAKHTRSLRGVRGVPLGEVARVAAELWTVDPPELPRDAEELSGAFGSAWEDGLVAIALLSTVVPRDPETARSMALDWAERTDDVTTADALGWLVLAPVVLLTGALEGVMHRLGAHHRPFVRRCAVSMGLGFTPTVIEGPCAAALREQHGERHVRLVDASRSELLAPLCRRFVRDDAPAVQKGLRRVLRAWSDDAPDAVAAWGRSVPGGLPRMLGDEVKRAQRREAPPR